MDTLRERFDRNIRAKAGIGHPFTMEDVADSLGVPSSHLRSSWLVPFRDADVIRNVGTQPSRSKKHQVTVWQGTYYLDLEAEEQAERDAMTVRPITDERLAEGFKAFVKQAS